MDNIKEAVSALFAVEHYRKAIDDFAYKSYELHFKKEINDSIKNRAFHFYEGFDVLKDNQIKVNYSYGAGDMEFHDSFLVEIK